MYKKYSIISYSIFCFMIFFSDNLKPSEDKDLKINSIDAQIIESLDNGNLSLKGRVIIKTDIVELWSDEAIYDRENQIISLNGNIEALSKNLSVKAQSMDANFFKEEFYLSESSFNFMGKGFGEAQLVNINFNEDIELLNISISSCKEENLGWALEAKKITILEDRKNVVIRDIKLEVSKTPVLYLPYLRTAIGSENFSGFLSPSIKQGKDGFDLSIPYFFSLAPNYDLTVTPRYIQERGSGISAEGRFLSKSSEGLVAFSHFSKDRKFFAQTKEENQRWATRVFSESNLGSSVFLKIDTEHVSDALYFEDLNDDILGTQQKDFLRRNILIRYDHKDLKLRGEINQFQNLNPFLPNDYDTEPHINFDYRGQFNAIKVRLISDFIKFSLNENYNPLERKENVKRIYVEPSLGFEKENNSSLTSFNIGRRETDYEDEGNSTNNSYNWAELTYKIFLDKRTKSSFHTLSPIMKIIWIDSENIYKKSFDSKLLDFNYDTLFEKNWYSGSDLFLEENRLIIGLEHNFYNTINGNRGYFSIGKAFFDNKEIIRERHDSMNSFFVSELSLDLTSNLKINGSIEVNSDLERISRGQLGIVYERDTRKNIQLRSIYKREIQNLNQSVVWNDSELSLNQVELISQWDLSANFLFFGKLSKDLELNYSRDISYGIEYSNCCLKLGLMKRKWLDQNYYMFFNLDHKSTNIIDSDMSFERERDNIYFFFELKELGRFGKKISNVLRSRSFQ